MQIKNNNQNFTTGFHIVRVGLAITFIWIGILILKSPESWGGYVQPWAVNLLPISVQKALLSTAVLDIIIGIFLLIDWLTWLAGLVAALHIIVVLTVSGITDITVRDIAILAAAVALMADSLPKNFTNKILQYKGSLYNKAQAIKNNKNY